MEDKDDVSVEALDPNEEEGGFFFPDKFHVMEFIVNPPSWGRNLLLGGIGHDGQ